MVVILPRTPGRKDSEFMHLFCGPVDFDAHAAEASAARSAAPTWRGNLAELEERVEQLEAEIAALNDDDSRLPWQDGLPPAIAEAYARGIPLLGAMPEIEDSLAGLHDPLRRMADAAGKGAAA